jgi:ornithine carbamoyltransferase
MPHHAPPLSAMPTSVLPLSATALDRSADELAQATQRGAPHRPLVGMRLGLFCGDERSETARCLREAAQALGAQVTMLDPARALEEGAALDEIARLLGHLYAAVACEGVPAAVMRGLAMAAAVPVLDARAVLAPASGRGTGAERRPWIAQAALLAALR